MFRPEYEHEGRCDWCWGIRLVVPSPNGGGEWICEECLAECVPEEGEEGRGSV